MFDALIAWLECFWVALQAWVADLWVGIVETILNVLVSIVVAIPVPDGLAAGIGNAYAVLDPSVLYFLNLSKFPEAMAIVGAGALFRMVRKLVTLGQW